MCAVDLDRVDDALAYLGCTARGPDPRSAVARRGRAARSSTSATRSARASTRRAVVDSLRARLDALGAVARRRRGRDPCSSSSGPTRRSAPGTGSPTSWPRVVAPRCSRCPAVTRGGSRGTRCASARRRRRARRAVRLPPRAATGFAEQLVADDRLPGGAEVWAVDADSHFVRPGPRLVDGAETVAQILHPGIVGAPAADGARRVDVRSRRRRSRPTRDVKQVTSCAPRPAQLRSASRCCSGVAHG